MITENDYINQLEETNRRLQEKLEESEKKHDNFLDKPLFIYTSGNSGLFDSLSFEDKNGNAENEERYVTSLRYVQKEDKVLGDGRDGDIYIQTWLSDENGAYRWTTEKVIDIQVSSINVNAKKRKLDVKWSQAAINDMQGMYGLDMQAELEREILNDIQSIVLKPSRKQVKKYGKTKNDK
jgi:hypothetical protein